MRDQHNQISVVVFALNLGDRYAEIKAIREALGEDIPFKECEGSYVYQDGERKGERVHERSYFINLSDFSEKLKELLATTLQESVLIRDGEFQCWLCNRSDNYDRVHSAEGVKAQWLGKWTEVPVTIAEKNSAWTRINGRYFVALK